MEKINGVTMDGHTVVDIDRNADEVVIPEYAKDTTYQLPLYGIKSMEVSDLMLLAQFAGLPKRLVLNDKGNLASYSLSYWSGVNAIDSVLGRAGLEWLELTDDNPYFKTVDGILYSRDGKKLLKCPAKKTGEVIIPNGVIEICAHAFGNSEIESVIFPDSLKVIGSYAFKNCSYLKNVDFGNGITQIGDSNEKDIRSFGYLFENCESLKDVNIPEQVEVIGHSAFSKSGVETVELPAGIKKICECAFDRCNIRRISLPAAVELGSDAISEVSEIHVEDGEHLPHGIIQSMSKYNGLAKYITPDSSLVVKITQGNKTTYIPKDFSGMHTTIDTDNPSMDDLLTFFHKNHVRILRFLVRSNAAKDFCNALSISDCSNEELLRLLSATNDKSMVIRAYILDALSEKEEKSEKLKL